MAKKKNQKSKQEESSAVETVSGLAALASSELSFLDDTMNEFEKRDAAASVSVSAEAGAHEAGHVEAAVADSAVEALETVAAVTDDPTADQALIEQELGAASDLDFVEDMEDLDAEEDADMNLSAEDESAGNGFAADSEVVMGEGEVSADETSMDAGELSAFSSAEVEDVEKLSEIKIASIVESLLFATDKPITAHSMKAAFQGTSVRVADIRKALEQLKMEYANDLRGVSLEEVAGGYQLRTKVENQTYLLRTVKARPFKVSGPALEVLSIVAYKQPCTKSAVDEIRGVESGHLMRGLLDRGLISFAGKSDLPGRPMMYETTRRFLETFSLRNIKELPTLSEIDELIPEGIGEEVVEKPKLSDLTGELSQTAATTYSEGEEELIDISKELSTIDTTSAFFEDEKRRAREKRELERAQDIRDRLTVGEAVEDKDRKWLARYEAALAAPAIAEQGSIENAVPAEVANAEVAAVSETVSVAEVTTGENVNEQGPEPTA